MSQNPTDNQKLKEFLKDQGDRLLLVADGNPPQPGRDFLLKEEAELLRATMKEQEMELMKSGPFSRIATDNEQKDIDEVMEEVSESAGKKRSADPIQSGPKKLSRHQRRFNNHLGEKLDAKLKELRAAYFTIMGKVRAVDVETSIKLGLYSEELMPFDRHVKEGRRRLLEILNREWKSWVWTKQGINKKNFKTVESLFLQAIVRDEQAILDKTLKESGKNFDSSESSSNLAADGKEARPEQMEIASEDTGQEGEAAPLSGGADQADEGRPGEGV